MKPDIAWPREDYSRVPFWLHHDEDIYALEITALRTSMPYEGNPGKSVIGYDNERGKGDHRHVRNREESYRFSSVEALIADFLSDVKRERGAR